VGTDVSGPVAQPAGGRGLRPAGGRGLRPAAAAKEPSRTFQVVVLVLFFVSGACGLIYEVLWARLLTLSFGVTVLAASTVVAAFMGGLALGSYLFGRWSDRFETYSTAAPGRRGPAPRAAGLLLRLGGGRGSPAQWGLRLFALLEVGIALYAVAFPSLLGVAEALFAPLYRWQPPAIVFHLARFLVTFVLLLVPTTLMGGTLPVLVRLACRRARSAGWRVGLLYGANTAGAVFGCALAGFWLAATVGTNVSVRLAAAGNVAVALVAWTLARTHTGSEPVQEPVPAPPPSAAGSAEPSEEEPAPLAGRTTRMSRTVRLVLLVAGVSGFCALSYELLWFRMLTVILQDYSTYSFAAMLSTFLAGLAVGSWVWGWLLRRAKRPVMLLGIIEAAIGVLGLLSIGYFRMVQKWYMTEGMRWTWSQPALAMMAVTALAIFLPVTLMGGALPVAGAAVVGRLKNLGRSIGDLYAINTLGAIAGAFVPVFILIPTVGTQWAVLITAGLNVVAGVVLLVTAPRTTRVERIVLTAGSLALVVMAVGLLRGNSFRALFEYAIPSADRQLLYYRDGVTGTVTIHQTSTMKKLLCINGLPEVPTDHATMKTFRVMGHVPMLLHPDPQRVLSITFGGGIVAGAMAQHEPRVLDAVDVCEGVFKAAPLLSKENQDVLNYPGLRTFVNDARNFIAHTPDTYDVIISDCSHPKSGDSWVLFTREFYQDVRRRLSDDGVLAQFILIHRMTYPEFRTLLGTLQEVFPHTTLWVADAYVLAVATVQPLAIDYERLSERLQQPRVKASLAPFGMDEPANLLANLCVDERGVRDLTEGAPINTEDQPFVGLSHLWVRETIPVTLRQVFKRLAPVSSVLGNLPADPEQAGRITSEVERASLSHHQATWAEYAYGQRQFPRAIKLARTALTINPRDPNAQYVLGAAGADLEARSRFALSKVQFFPEQASGYSDLARVLAARGDLSRAADMLKKTISLGLDTVAVREQLGRLYSKMGQPLGASRQFREALKQKPKSVSLQVSLARTLMAQRRTEEAEQLVRKALARDPDNVPGLEALGSLLLARGEIEQAQVQFEAMLRSNPFLASPYVHLAHCYELRKLMPQALANYGAALENDPYVLQAYLGLIRLLAGENRWQAARNWALRGLQFLPISGELFLALGDASLAGGDLPAAQQAYRRVLETNPNLTPAYAGLAESAAGLGDLATARACWQEVLRRDPQSEYARQRLQGLPAVPDEPKEPARRERRLLPPG